MRAPFWLQGMIVAPMLIGILFIARVRSLLPPVFMPVVMFQRLLGTFTFIHNHEASCVFFYWALVGALVGLCFDVFRTSPYCETRSV